MLIVGNYSNLLSSHSMIAIDVTRSQSVSPTPSHDIQPSTWHTLLVSTACALIIAGTILGNVLVCTAVGITRKLRAPPSNLLIVSLAVSDLLVAALDMPFATAYEVMGRWVLGPTMCDVWTSLDVFLCTASILNLCVISVDRYLVITRPFQYAIKRTPWRMLLMISAVWALSAIISIPPLFYSKSSEHLDVIRSDTLMDSPRVRNDSVKLSDYTVNIDTFSDVYQCQVSQNIGYQFYATIAAFYIPLLIMIVIYTRIYHVSSRIARSEIKSKIYLVQPSTSGSPLQSLIDGHRQMSLTPTLAGSTTTLQRVGVNNTHLGDDTRRISSSPSQSGFLSVRNSRGHSLGDLLPHKIRTSCVGSRTPGGTGVSERKATKTLGVIMGAFVVCWLPFFILALIKPFCEDPNSCIPAWLGSLFLWLGFANSFLNPIIYARFNRDFRTPFKYILQCKCHNINARMRNEEYTVQFGPMSDRRESTLTNGIADNYIVQRL